MNPTLLVIACRSSKLRKVEEDGGQAEIDGEQPSGDRSTAPRCRRRQIDDTRNSHDERRSGCDDRGANRWWSAMEDDDEQCSGGSLIWPSTQAEIHKLFTFRSTPAG
ncbi:unnamed protein product [Linum trigynum]|uniref:Uncharacterized protein n=1 Tax=Linum trigynum TaxID=586398 RepID=A0AAV2FUB7_9ROSI